MDSVRARKARNYMVLVFVCSSLDVISHTDVKRSRTASQNVHVKCFCLHERGSRQSRRQRTAARDPSARPRLQARPAQDDNHSSADRTQVCSTIKSRLIRVAPQVHPHCSRAFAAARAVNCALNKLVVRASVEGADLAHLHRRRRPGKRPLHRMGGR
jgi:hypothetical protein